LKVLKIPKGLAIYAAVIFAPSKARIFSKVPLVGVEGAKPLADNPQFANFAICSISFHFQLTNV
jgi:hypothetical protein